MILMETLGSAGIVLALGSTTALVGYILDRGVSPRGERVGRVALVVGATLTLVTLLVLMTRVALIMLCAFAGGC